ncbi:MAG: neutral/alkaline non-lysosomal ceramidase N-terminal domain-containing protein [Bacteroidota bacterium]
MKLIRIILKILGPLVALVVILLIWALQKVDNTPYFEAEYYSQTRSRLDSAANLLTLQRGAPEVGFGKVPIIPETGGETEDPRAGIFRVVPLAGYGDREGAPAQGVHDSLFVKAAAMRVKEHLLVLVAADILIVPPGVSAGVAEEVNRQLGIGRDQLFFSATHTHSGLGAWSEGFVGRQFAGDPNPGVVEWLTGRYVAAIVAAVEDLKPGSIGTGSFFAPQLVRNRLVGEKGQEESEFVFLVAEQDSGQRAILGSFSAHATTLGGDNMLLSGDYPGYWQRKMERGGFDLALFFAGSMGSHGPETEGEGFERARFLGETLADSSLDHAGQILAWDSIGFSYVSLELELPPMHIRVSDRLGLRPSLGRKLFPPMGDVYLQAVRIGDLVWASTPCDFSGELALVHKNAMHKEGYRAMVTSFNGAYTGYVIPGKYYHLDAYESRLMSWFGPHMGPYTNEMIRRMMDTLVAL